MARRNRWIPFGWLPGHWGLTSEHRDRALVEYYYDGYDLEIGLLDLNKDSKDNSRDKLEVQFRYEIITEYEYQQGIIDIETADDPKANKLAKLKLDYDQGKLSAPQYNLKSIEIEHTVESDEYKIELLQQSFNLGEITRNEFEKKAANILEQPWIKVVSSSYDPEQGIDGFTFELDYNGIFVQYLKENGYTGLNNDEVVEDWFNDVSKGELVAEIENDFSIPKTKISSEVIKTTDGKAVKKFS